MEKTSEKNVYICKRIKIMEEKPMAHFVETGSTRVEELTDEQVQYFIDHKEEFNKTFDKVSESVKEALKSHKEACARFNEVFRGK